MLGNVRTTVASFIDTFQPAPIGGVSYDLDFYSSTMDALKLFDVQDEFILPRVFCYFDDVMGGEIQLYSDYTGERAAILDFNATHKDRKLSQAYYLQPSVQPWHHQIWILHNFNHRDYEKFIGQENLQLKLREVKSRRARRDGQTQRLANQMKVIRHFSRSPTYGPARRPPHNTRTISSSNKFSWL